MFRRNTVFILGAGASVHYGYPTGEELVRQVVENARRLGGICKRGHDHQTFRCLKFGEDGDLAGNDLRAIEGRWEKRHNKCRELDARIKASNPLVIDYFLGLNSDIQDLGRMLIAWAILEREADSAKRGHDWIRFVLHQLMTDCSPSSALADNRIDFVTFNYDVSLERRLRRGLAANQYFSAEDIDSFFATHPIIHVYGSVRDSQAATLDFRALAPRDGPVDKTEIDALDQIYELSKRIRVIDPNDKASEERALDDARHRIRNARAVYVLGFGFDGNNIDRLDLSSIATGSRTVLFTNMDNHGSINKRADRLLGLRGENSFTEGKTRVVDLVRDYVAEKSTRDVYGALAFDFDTLDELPP